MMKKFLTILIVLLVAQSGFGQQNVSQLTDSSPLFNGSTLENHGIKLINYFNGCGLKVSENGKNCHIAVTYVIDEKGVPNSPILLIGNDSIMFNRVIECMQKSPNWIPAKKNGIDVSCQYNIAFEK